MPDVSRTEIGRRIFQLNKEKGVEAAIEKIRQRLGNEWKTLALDQIESLRLILGELWVYIDRGRWDAYAFSAISLEDLRALARIGEQVRDRSMEAKDGIDRAAALLAKYSG